MRMWRTGISAAILATSSLAFCSPGHAGAFIVLPSPDGPSIVQEDPVALKNAVTYSDERGTRAGVAKADLSRGVIGSSASATSTDKSLGTQTSAYLTDSIFLNVPGSNADTLTEVEFSFWLSGHIQQPSPANLSFGTTFYVPGYSLPIGYAYSADGYGNSSHNSSDNWGFLSYSGGLEYQLIVGRFNLIGPDPTFSFLTGMTTTASSNAGQSASIDYAHTATLRFNTPPGVTWTSQSGSFLSAVSPVPEPATWMMMLCGFGATGWAMRRRNMHLAGA